MKWIFSILLLLVSSTGFGQGFTYSYVDPCSKKLKVINIPNANSTVTVNYLGYVNTFTKDDFDNGSFAGWVGDLSTKYASAPCDEIKTKTQVSQNTILTQNIISTLSSVMSVSTMTVASSIGSMSAGGLSNSVDNSSSGDNGGSSGKGSGKNGKNDKNNTQSGTNTTENGGNNTQSGTSTGNIGQNNPNSGSNSPQNEPQTPQNEPQTGNNPQTPKTGENTGTNPPTNPQTPQNNGNTGTNPPTNPQTPQTGENTGNPGSNTGNSGSNSGSNTGQNGGNTGNSGGNGGNGTAEPKNDPTTTPTDNKSGGNGGTTNSVANAAESSSSGSGSGGKPSSKTTAKTGSIVGTGDIVVIRSAEDNSNQFKATMSMTKSNTDNSRSKGALLNFTTTVNNSNLTLYTALTNKKKTNTAIFANSSMIDLDRNFFNTTTALESHKFNKVSLMGGANFTIGDLDGEMFTNLSAVGGGFYMFKVGKKVSANVLMLAVYSPFTKFYEGRWWSSGVLLVPFSSWDYSISKNFKFNVSFSGTYQYSDKFLNYQILTGGKIML